MPTPVLIALGIAALLLITLLGVCIYFFNFAHRRKDNMTNELLSSEVRVAYHDMVESGMAYIAAHESEEITVTSFDGLKLRGLFIPAERPRGCILCFHGYRSEGLQDFAPMPEYYNSLGLHVLIADQRASGKSEGKYTTFGILERRDVVTWANEMNARLGGMPLILDGISMGASSVMLAANEKLPASVKGIIADCGFTSPWDIIAHCGKQWFHIPPFPLVYILSGMARLCFGEGYRSCSTLTSLANSNHPLLLLHGGEDDFVPTYMSEENYNAATGYKRKLIVPGAGHGMSYLIDQPQCQKMLQDFVDYILS